jgi:hypothetical protein
MKRITVALFLIWAIPITFASGGRAAEGQSDTQAQVLLQKHRAYVGWQLGDGTFQTIRISGTVTNKQGEKLESVALNEAGLAFRETHTMLKQDNITEHFGFTGAVFWQCFTSGFTMPVYGEGAKALAAYTMLMQEGTAGLAGSFRGNKIVDGKSVGVVRVTMLHGDPIDLYIDPSTGAYVQATVDPDGAFEETYHVLSYAEVQPGKKMIGSYRVDDSEETYTNEKFEPNAAVTNDDLHPPKATATWIFTSDRPVPIHLTHDRILVDAKVNGVKGTFILDTGSDAIRLDDKFADAAHVETLKGDSQSETVYGEMKDRVRSVGDIDFGNAHLQNVLVYSENFERWNYKGLDTKGYAGLIGADFFAGVIVKLNVYDSTMSIVDPSTDLSSLKMLPVLVDLTDAELTVPMTLDNSIAVNAVLDTGNPDAVLFSYDLVKKHHPFNPRTLTLGPIHYRLGGWDGCCMAGNYALLGYDFLKHFDYVFDYPHGRLFMTPNKN